MKKIGIVVPVYNSEIYLKKCIESILDQTYKNIEVILVDDGSTDNSGKICDKYAQSDSRVSVIHEKNLGPIKARYRGILNSKCDYITFVDADDWIDLHTYEYVSICLDSDVDVIMFQMIRYFDEKNKVRLVNKYVAGRYERNEIESDIFPNMIWNDKMQDYGVSPSLCDKVIKREKLLKEFENIKELQIHYGEDVAVVYPLFLEINSLVIMDDYLYYHRQRNRTEIAEYIKDSDYYKKLYILYDYLKKRINIQELKKQIDYFYFYSVSIRLRIYGDRRSSRGYVFPFDKIPKNCNIAIYGASEIGQLYYEQVQRINYCTVVLWVDQNYLSYQHIGVKETESIRHNMEYDYIVVAVGAKEIAKQIIFDLIGMGIQREKIVWSIK
jgi:glycosyltransferase involved in cell wall biosynthesis